MQLRITPSNREGKETLRQEKIRQVGKLRNLGINNGVYTTTEN